MFYVGVGRLKGGAEPRPAFTGGNNQWIWNRPVLGRPQMQQLKETEGMGDAPPNHWTKNLRFRVISARYFWAYARLDLRTPKRRGTKERVLPPAI